MPGLCRWHGGPHQFRHLSLCTGIAAGCTQGAGGELPGEPAVRDPGRRNSLARVDGDCGLAIATTYVAAAAAMVMWITVERILDGAPTSIGAMSGAVAGLAA